MSALLAARFGPELPVSYLNFGGYGETAGVARYTRLSNADLLRNIATSAATANDPDHEWLLGDLTDGVDSTRRSTGWRTGWWW